MSSLLAVTFQGTILNSAWDYTTIRYTTALYSETIRNLHYLVHFSRANGKRILLTNLYNLRDHQHSAQGKCIFLNCFNPIAFCELQ